MTKPWLGKVGALFIQKRGCIVSTHPLFVASSFIFRLNNRGWMKSYCNRLTLFILQILW